MRKNHKRFADNLKVGLESNEITVIAKHTYKNSVELNGYLKCPQKMYNVKNNAAVPFHILFKLSVFSIFFFLCKNFIADFFYLVYIIFRVIISFKNM